MSELSGQAIVITGGETGIGRAAVLQLAAEGAHVLIGGILSDEADVTLTVTVPNDGGDLNVSRATKG